MAFSFRRPATTSFRRPCFGEQFGIRSRAQLVDDLSEMVHDSVRGRRFQFDWRSIGILRPALSLPAYAGLVPKDGLAPIFNLFDRTGGGRHYSQRVSRTHCRDFRGGTLTYDEHDGTDIVVPPGTRLVAAAPGIVVMIRDRWLRGGLTVAVDHGHGVLTQYTHCARAITQVGQRVQRNQPIALSGTSGVDMTMFFPWVAPHIHFMVYVAGRPVDPFLAADESARPGTWLHGNRPRPSLPLPSDVAEVQPSSVDADAMARVIAACTDTRLQQEIACRETEASRAALLEDALCHDNWAFSPEVHEVSVRQDCSQAVDISITLPLAHGDYDGVRLADTRFSAPVTDR